MRALADYGILVGGRTRPVIDLRTGQRTAMAALRDQFGPRPVAAWFGDRDRLVLVERLVLDPEQPPGLQPDGVTVNCCRDREAARAALERLPHVLEAVGDYALFGDLARAVGLTQEQTALLLPADWSVRNVHVRFPKGTTGGRLVAERTDAAPLTSYYPTDRWSLLVAARERIGG
jgi:hypothetical protein